MIKTAAILLAISAVAMSQYRPSYYPRPGGFSTSLTNNNEGPANVGDRNSAFQPDAPGSDNHLVDTQLNNRFQNQNYPKEKLPFWYVNREIIQQHTNQQVPCTGSGCQATANRGSFSASAAAPRPSFAGSSTRN